MDLNPLRVRAESMLQTLEALSVAGQANLNAKHLAEELRVYQAELDIQNQELKGANAALEALRFHYRSLFMNMPVPALIVRQDGTITESNRIAQTVFPLLKTASSVRSVYGLLADRTDTALSELLRNAQVSASDGRRDVFLSTPLRAEHPFTAFTHRMPEAGADDSTVLLLLVDRAAEQVEREWMERFFKIAEHIPGMLYQFQVTPEGQMTFPFATRGIEKIYAVTPEEARLDAATVISRLHPDDMDRVVATILQSQSSLEPWRARYRVCLPSGVTLWVEGEAGPERLPDGGTLWHGYIRDITASVQLEEQLRWEKQRLANVIDGTGVGTWEWNVQTGECRFNERWAGMMGYRLDELQPVSIATWMRLAHPDDLKRSEDQLQRHFNGELEYYEAEARMQHREGHWVWVLDRGRVITRTPEGLPEWMAGTHLDITDRKIMEARLSQLANHDSLTGLPRRTLFADRLAQAMAQARRRNTRLALAFIDLDGFKCINDVHGHAGGDRLLVELARRMSSLLRSGDTVARLGGDEFVMILSDLQPDDDGLKHLQRVTNALSQPVDFEGKALAITSSVGVAHYPAEVDIDQDELIRRADKAMYAAKSAGKNRICVG